MARSRERGGKGMVATRGPWYVELGLKEVQVLELDVLECDHFDEEWVLSNDERVIQAGDKGWRLGHHGLRPPRLLIISFQCTRSPTLRNQLNGQLPHWEIA